MPASLASRMINPYYKPLKTDEEISKTLEFDSVFESGNLAVAIKVSDTEYNCLLQKETYKCKVQSAESVQAKVALSVWNEGAYFGCHQVSAGRNWHRRSTKATRQFSFNVYCSFQLGVGAEGTTKLAAILLKHIVCAELLH